MNKKELVTQMVKKTGLTASVASKAVDVLFDAIRDSLEKGESTVLHGFGSFGIKEHSERKGFNPATKQPMIIPARRMIKFTASKNIEIK